MNWYIIFGLIIIFLVVGWFTTSGIKSQLIRLGDIFLFGPFLIWTATQVEYWWAKVILIAFGASTMAYNARNWLYENRAKNVAISHPSSWN